MSSNPDPRFKPLDDQHRVVITESTQSVSIDGIAKSSQPLVLKESHTLADGTSKSYPDVYYIDPKDIDFDKLEKTETKTYCPYKGDASYYSIKGGAKDAAWVYEDAYEQVGAIKGFLSFYPDRASIVTGA